MHDDAITGISHIDDHQIISVSLDKEIKVLTVVFEINIICFL